MNNWDPTGERYAYDAEKEQYYIEYKNNDGETSRYYLTAEQSANWNDWIQGNLEIGNSGSSFSEALDASSSTFNSELNDRSTFVQITLLEKAGISFNDITGSNGADTQFLVDNVII